MVAKIFVAVALTRGELVAALCERLGLSVPAGFVGRFSGFEFEVINNPDRRLATADPDDFLCYPLVVEVLDKETASDRAVDVLEQIVLALSECGATYVVASDFEEDLAAGSRNDRQR